MKSPCSRSPLLLLLGAAACSSHSPEIGIERVLAETGLPDLLLEQAKSEVGSVKVTIGESRSLLQLVREGELDLALTNGDADTDALLREGRAASAEPVLHHEMVLVGPETDPVGIHAERKLENALRMLVEGDATFYRCSGCGARAREDAIFERARLPRRGHSFLDVGQSEDEVVASMRNAPGYALLSRPTALLLLKKKEWSFKPLWSGDALQADVYRVVTRSSDQIPEPRRAAALALAKWLRSEPAQATIDRFGVDEYGQPLFQPGAPAEGRGAQFF